MDDGMSIVEGGWFKMLDARVFIGCFVLLHLVVWSLGYAGNGIGWFIMELTAFYPYYESTLRSRPPIHNTLLISITVPIMSTFFVPSPRSISTIPPLVYDTRCISYHVIPSFAIAGFVGGGVALSVFLFVTVDGRGERRGGGGGLRVFVIVAGF